MSVIQCPVQPRVQLGDPTKSTAKFASFTQVNWQGSTHFGGPTSELENFYILLLYRFLFVLWKSHCSGIDYVFPTYS